MTPFGGDLLKENVVLQLGDFPPAPPVPPCLCHSWHAARSSKARDDLKVVLLAQSDAKILQLLALIYSSSLAF